jgi:hypothetical protein
MNTIDTFDSKEDNEDKGKGGDQDMEAVKPLEKVSQTEWLTTGQAKEILGVSSVNTVKRWVAEGKLEARKIGQNNWMRISSDSIRRLLQSGDKNVQAFRRLKKQFDSMSDLDFELTEEDLSQMSDRNMGKLPWENSKDK